MKGLGFGDAVLDFSVASPGCPVRRIWIQFSELRSELACNGVGLISATTGNTESLI